MTASDIGIKIAGLVVTLVPYFALAFAPVWDTLRYSKRAVLWCMIGVTALQITTTMLIMLFVPDWSRWTAPSSIAYLLLYIALYLLVVRAQPTKLLFILLVAKMYGDIISSMAFALDSNFFPQPEGRDSYGLWGTVLNVLLLLPTFPFLWRFFRRSLRFAFQKNTRAWRYLWIVPLVFYILFASFTAMDGTLVAQWQYIVFDIAMLVGSFVVYYTVVQMVEQTERSILLDQGVKAMSAQLTMQVDQYRRLGEHIEGTRKAEHDLRHHLHALRGLVASGDAQAAIAYIDRLIGDASRLSDLLFCEHAAINALLCYLADACAQNGIACRISADIRQDIGIPESDLCVVLGNLVENALQACQRMREGRRFIEVNAQTKGALLTIAVDNSFDGDVRRSGMQFLSTRRDNGEVGLGLSSIRALAERHGGAATFAYTADAFQASVLLQAGEAVPPSRAAVRGRNA